jgi:hypothetical protein
MVIKRVRGDNYDLSFQIVDINDEPIDLTGAVVLFTVKDVIQREDSQAKISVDVYSFVDAVNGMVNIPLTSEETNLVGTFKYDLKVIISSEISSVIVDDIIFIDNVTKRIA